MGFKVKDSIKFYSLVLNVATITMIVLMLKQCHCPPCMEPGETKIVHDTIWPKAELKPIAVKVPEAYKAVARKDIKPAKAIARTAAFVRSFPDTARNHTVDSNQICYDECDSVRYYSDTIRNHTPDTCEIVINDTVIGKITGRSVWYVNLKPEIRTTITQVRKEKLKVYVGGAFTLNARFGERWGAGPSALMAIPKVGAINYYYDAKNNAHTAALMALIRFHK